MTVGLLIITHNNIGAELLNSAQGILKQSPMQMRAIGISSNCIPEEEYTEICAHINELDDGNGVLILSDIFGATPCNIARRLIKDNTRLVTGVNLAMIIRIMNYPKLSLEALVDKAISAGHDSIFNFQPGLEPSSKA